MSSLFRRRRGQKMPPESSFRIPLRRPRPRGDFPQPEGIGLKNFVGIQAAELALPQGQQITHGNRLSDAAAAAEALSSTAPHYSLPTFAHSWLDAGGGTRTSHPKPGIVSPSQRVSDESSQSVQQQVQGRILKRPGEPGRAGRRPGQRTAWPTEIPTKPCPVPPLKAPQRSRAERSASQGISLLRPPGSGTCSFQSATKSNNCRSRAAERRISIHAAVP